MATITAHGIHNDSLGTWVDRYGEAFQNALGEDLSLDSATPQGRLIRVLAVVGVQMDELATHVAAGLNLYQARGRQLTDYATLMGIPFRAGARSTVTGTITGDAGTRVVAGARARTAAGAIFRLDDDVLIPQAETIDALFRSDRIGAVKADIGELTSIVDVTPGWTGITNAAAAALGRAAETDLEWVERYISRVPVHGHGALAAIAARVREVEGVTRIRVLNNATNVAVTTDTFVVAANSFAVVVLGGVSADIAAAIAATAPPGIAMTGDTTHTIGLVTYRFSRATEIALAVTVSTTITPGFPADGETRMTNALVAYVSGLAIGEDVDLSRMRATLAAVTGHTITAFAVTRSGGGALGNAAGNSFWSLAASGITINLAV